jgi:hypothetical protein
VDKVQGIVDKVLKTMGLKNRALEYKVMDLWEDMVGDTIAKHTSVASIHQGVLFVKVDHPVWIQHLSFSALDIKNRLNKALGTKVVKEIRFQAGNWCEKQKKYPNVDNNDTSNINLPIDAVEEIQEMVQIIEDSDLRRITASVIKRGKIQKLQKEIAGWKMCPTCGVFINPKQKICIHCNLKQENEIKGKTRALLWEVPWLPYNEIQPYVLGLTEEIYQEVRRTLIQELWSQFREVTKAKQKINIPKSHIHTYIMLFLGYPPEKVNDEIIWQTLGENMSKKLLGGQ